MREFYNTRGYAIGFIIDDKIKLFLTALLRDGFERIFKEKGYDDNKKEFYNYREFSTKI